MIYEFCIWSTWLSGIIAITNTNSDSASPWKIPLRIFTTAKLFPSAVNSILQFFMVFSINFMTSSNILYILIYIYIYIYREREWEREKERKYERKNGHINVGEIFFTNFVNLDWSGLKPLTDDLYLQTNSVLMPEDWCSRIHNSRFFQLSDLNIRFTDV